MIKDMKSVYYVILGCLALCFTSCKTTTNFTVYGEPGTQIFTPGKLPLATIDNTGKASISNPDDDYYAFLLSHKPGTEEYIPFALDYMKKTYPIPITVAGIGTVVGAAGFTCSFVGFVGVVSDADDDYWLDYWGKVFGVGAAGMLTGLGIAWPAYERCFQTNQLNCYKYLSEQKTNQDMQFTMPEFELYKPEAPVKQDADEKTASETNKTLSGSSSAKSLKDNASRIEGTYIGEGTLKQGSEIIEIYDDISINIKKKSKDVVLVNVIESDGSKFFTADGEYDIKKHSDGKYILTLKEITDATIEIDTNNNLIYIHPRVNIEEEIYELTIKAKK